MRTGGERAADDGDAIVHFERQHAADPAGQSRQQLGVLSFYEEVA
jgi:hypothetical protein